MNYKDIRFNPDLASDLLMSTAISLRMGSNVLDWIKRSARYFNLLIKVMKNNLKDPKIVYRGLLVIK